MALLACCLRTTYTHMYVSCRTQRTRRATRRDETGYLPRASPPSLPPSLPPDRSFLLPREAETSKTSGVFNMEKLFYCFFFPLARRFVFVSPGQPPRASSLVLVVLSPSLSSSSSSSSRSPRPSPRPPLLPLSSSPSPPPAAASSRSLVVLFILIPLSSFSSSSSAPALRLSPSRRPPPPPPRRLLSRRVSVGGAPQRSRPG